MRATVPWISAVARRMKMATESVSVRMAIRRGGEPVSGVRVVLSGSTEAPRIQVTWEDGSAIAPLETVHIATTDYLASNGDGMSTLQLAPANGVGI